MSSKSLRQHPMCILSDRYEDPKGKRSVQLTASPIKLVDSKQYPGIQIADVFASSLCYALNNQDDQFCKDLIEKFGPAISECSVVPDLDYVDLSTETGFVNSVLLQELVDRQIRGKYLYDGLPEIRMAARRVFPQFRASIGEELIHAEVNQ